MAHTDQDDDIDLKGFMKQRKSLKTGCQDIECDGSPIVWVFSFLVMVFSFSIGILRYRGMI